VSSLTLNLIRGDGLDLRHDALMRLHINNIHTRLVTVDGGNALANALDWSLSLHTLELLDVSPELTIRDKVPNAWRQLAYFVADVDSTDGTVASLITLIKNLGDRNYRVEFKLPRPRIVLNASWLSLVNFLSLPETNASASSPMHRAAEQLLAAAKASQQESELDEQVIEAFKTESEHWRIDAAAQLNPAPRTQLNAVQGLSSAPPHRVTWKDTFPIVHLTFKIEQPTILLVVDPRLDTSSAMACSASLFQIKSFFNPTDLSTTCEVDLNDIEVKYVNVSAANTRSVEIPVLGPTKVPIVSKFDACLKLNMAPSQVLQRSAENRLRLKVHIGMVDVRFAYADYRFLLDAAHNSTAAVVTPLPSSDRLAWAKLVAAGVALDVFLPDHPPSPMAAASSSQTSVAQKPSLIAMTPRGSAKQLLTARSSTGRVGGSSTGRPSSASMPLFVDPAEAERHQKIAATSVALLRLAAESEIELVDVSAVSEDGEFEQETTSELVTTLLIRIRNARQFHQGNTLYASVFCSQF
jgi:hypothetical protein